MFGGIWSEMPKRRKQNPRAAKDHDLQEQQFHDLAGGPGLVTAVDCVLWILQPRNVMTHGVTKKITGGRYQNLRKKSLLRNWNDYIK